MKCKTQRNNILNSDKFSIVCILRSSLLPVGESLGTACGEAADTVSQLAHWADQPGLWELRSYVYHEYETGPISLSSWCLFSRIYAHLQLSRGCRKTNDMILWLPLDHCPALHMQKLHSSTCQDERTAAQISAFGKGAPGKEQPLQQCSQFPCWKLG